VALTDHLIVAAAGDRTVALRVDRALTISEIPDAEIAPATGALPGTGAVAGIARTADGLVLIHDLETFLSDAEARELALALANLERSQP
jgi:purine-binding chemotaxis protein CheW